MSYVSCIYDKQWWIGVVDEVSSDEGDIYVNFLHPSGPLTTFYWPMRGDKCWVPLVHIVQKVPQPSLVTAGSRDASIKNAISNTEQQKIQKCFNLSKNK